MSCDVALLYKSSSSDEHNVSSGRCGSPDLSAGIGSVGALLGSGVTAHMPGPLGMSINQLIQVLGPPTQAAIESSATKEK